MRKIAPSRLLFLLAMTTSACSGSRHRASPETPASLPVEKSLARTDTTTTQPIDPLLDHFHIESIVRPRGQAFTRQVALMLGDLSDNELERLVLAVLVEFDPDSMRENVARFMLEEAPQGYVAQIATWLHGGASATVDRQASSYTPPVPLEDWLATYTDDPPTEDRIQLVANWSEARQEGVFFLLLEQALDEAAHQVSKALRSQRTLFEPLRGEALSARLRQSSTTATLTALHAHEPIPDELIANSTLEYESEVGQWYVETYQIAVAEAVRAAGSRVAHTLSR